MASKCDSTNTSLNHIRKGNYHQYNTSKNFTLFAKDILKQFIADGLDDYISSNFARVDNLYPLDHRIFHNDMELKAKMKSVVKKTRKMERRAISCVYSLLQHIFTEPSAQNLLRLMESDMPFVQIDRLKQLYNNTTLSKDASELEEFHKMHRKHIDSIEAFIIRLDQQSHHLATERRYCADEKIKLAKVREAVKGTLLTIIAKELGKEGANGESVRRCVMDNKDLDVPESDSNFAGNVKVHRANSYRSSSRSAPPFRRGDSKSPVRVAAFARKLDNSRTEKVGSPAKSYFKITVL